MKFSSKHPVFIYAAAALLGFYAAANPTPWIFIPIIPFLFLDLKRALLCGALFATFYAYSTVTTPIPSIPPSGVDGEFLFTPSSVSASRSSFRSQWNYQGTVKFEGFTLPCQVSLPKQQTTVRPPADRAYLVKGTLKPGHGYRYSLYPDKEAPWFPVEGTHTWAEWRYASKQRVKEYVSKYYPSYQSTEFLGGILTGDFEDQAVKRSFGRAGLQHILAISGFHFTILTTVVLFLLRLALPPKYALNLLLLFLCSYFVFLGLGASILRAWLMSLIAIIGLLSRQTPVALNSLGFAVLAVLLIDPHLTYSIGFVFSFSVTASILLFFPIFKELLDRVFSPKDINTLKQLNFWDQHAYVIVSAAKNVIALSLAVNVAAIPLTLYFFGKFPLISLLCNLVVPLMVSVCMLLFVLGIFVPWLHYLNRSLVSMLLDFVNQLPAPLHVHWRMTLNKPVLFCWLTAAVIVGIWGWKRTQSRLEILC